MKYKLIALLLLAAPVSFGAEFMPDTPYKNLKCRKELQDQIKKLFTSSPSWSRVVDTDFETQAFRAPAATGEWYELHLSETKTPSITYFSPDKMKDYEWNDLCKMTTKEGAGFALVEKGKKQPTDHFSDKDLAGLLKSGKKGVIYLWSPRMVYSVTEFTRFRSVVERKRFQFTPVLDNAVSEAEAREAMIKAGVELKVRNAANAREPSSMNVYKRLDSVDLYMRNSNLHFPTIFVYGNGKVHSRRLVGVLTSEGLDKALDQWMEELK